MCIYGIQTHGEFIQGDFCGVMGAGARLERIIELLSGVWEVEKCLFKDVLRLERVLPFGNVLFY